MEMGDELVTAGSRGTMEAVVEEGLRTVPEGPSELETIVDVPGLKVEAIKGDVVGLDDEVRDEVRVEETPRLVDGMNDNVAVGVGDAEENDEDNFGDGEREL